MLQAMTCEDEPGSSDPVAKWLQAGPVLSPARWMMDDECWMMDELFTCLKVDRLLTFLEHGAWSMEHGAWSMERCAGS